ncbi:UNVERIFIED_CONTAM: hypothetical protein Sradi_5232000 [Sesamum radiatum]|uniref:Reverse transcriptase/retrotransposon-derived protein RNase H-like domain-containing protein n=1 Tax=Sesamum radiatum TaxID=300843 RepID=A0AAW2LMZ1_SESRA
MALQHCPSPQIRGKWRMCIDLRDLNKACPKDFYSLPRIDQLVGSTSGCELLSMMDALQGYHQKMLVAEDHKRVKNFEWTEECQREFEELKAYLAKLPLLVKPSPGDSLYLYISSTSQAVSSVPVREEEGTQTPITYVNKVLNGAESRYPPIEKMALALVITLSKCPYFLSYPVGVRTNTSLKQVLGKPEASRRLVKWAVELSEYDISYLPRMTMKAQALADFVFEMTGTTQEDVLEERSWILHVNGSSPTKGSGAGIVITSPQGEDMEFAIKFDFKASNNEAEYEALVLGMRIAQDTGALHLLASLIHN